MKPAAPIDLATLDPGIRETVRWLRAEGFETTDSGDGVSKEGEARVLDFPHVVIRIDPSRFMAECHRLRRTLEGRAVEIGPQGPDGTTPAIEASYDAGADVATLLLSGVNDASLGLDRHWVGSSCGIVSDLDTADYLVDDWEPCVLCDHENCRAIVRPKETAT